MVSSFTETVEGGMAVRHGAEAEAGLHEHDQVGAQTCGTRVCRGVGLSATNVMLSAWN